jgi:hypothetical protein
MEAFSTKEVIQLLVYLLILGLWSVLWSNYQDVKKKADQSQKELSEFKLHVSEFYHRKSDLEQFMERFDQQFHALREDMKRMFDLLDRKADKP